MADTAAAIAAAASGSSSAPVDSKQEKFTFESLFGDGGGGTSTDEQVPANGVPKSVPRARRYLADADEAPLPLKRARGGAGGATAAVAEGRLIEHTTHASYDVFTTHAAEFFPGLSGMPVGITGGEGPAAQMRSFGLPTGITVAPGPRPTWSAPLPGPAGVTGPDPFPDDQANVNNVIPINLQVLDPKVSLHSKYDLPLAGGEDQYMLNNPQWVFMRRDAKFAELPGHKLYNWAMLNGILLVNPEFENMSAREVAACFSLQGVMCSREHTPFQSTVTSQQVGLHIKGITAIPDFFFRQTFGEQTGAYLYAALVRTDVGKGEKSKECWQVEPRAVMDPREATVDNLTWSKGQRGHLWYLGLLHYKEVYTTSDSSILNRTDEKGLKDVMSPPDFEFNDPVAIAEMIRAVKRLPTIREIAYGIGKMHTWNRAYSRVSEDDDNASSPITAISHAPRPRLIANAAPDSR